MTDRQNTQFPPKNENINKPMSKHNQIETNYIQLYKKNCKACWKCIGNCPQKVIGKIDIFFHKHSRINNPEECNGCLKCVKICEYDAIRVRDKTSEVTRHRLRRRRGRI